MGGKGARLTANSRLAGRYLVLAPNQDLQGISRRLGEDARKRLKAMLKRVKPPEHGVIVRTAAEGATEEALEADLRRLLRDLGRHPEAKAKKGKAPVVLYEEPELTVRVVRDLFTDEEFKGLVTDSQRVHDKVLALRARGRARPRAEDHAAHRQAPRVRGASDRRADPQGARQEGVAALGRLPVHRAHRGDDDHRRQHRQVGRQDEPRGDGRRTRTWRRPARSARQLRLRDIGGIIVVDFIDMLLEKNKQQVEDTMREALALDKTRSQVFEIGPLGLMQVTRKRVSSGLVESFSETCPHVRRPGHHPHLRRRTEAERTIPCTR